MANKEYQWYCRGCPFNKSKSNIEVYYEPKNYEALILTDTNLQYAKDKFWGHFRSDLEKIFGHSLLANIITPCGRRSKEAFSFCLRGIMSRVENVKYVIVFGNAGKIFGINISLEHKIFKSGDKIFIFLPSLTKYIVSSSRSFYFQEMYNFLRRVVKEEKYLVFSGFKFSTDYGTFENLTSPKMIDIISSLNIRYVSGITPGLSEKILNIKSFVFDIETSGLSLDASLLSLSVYNPDTHEAFIFYGDVLKSEEFKNIIRKVYEDESISLIGHNLKFDITRLTYFLFGPINLLSLIPRDKKIYDTMLVRYSLSTELHSVSLKSLAGFLFMAPVWEYTDEGDPVIESIMDGTIDEEQLRYNAYDTLYTGLIFKKYEHAFKSPYYEVLREIQLITNSMTIIGTAIDLKKFQAKKEKLDKLIYEIEEKIQKQFNISNPNSLKELKDILRNRGINLPWKTPKGDISIGKENLQYIIDHPDEFKYIPKDIMELLMMTQKLRVLIHTRSTFYTTYENLMIVDKERPNEIARVHANFNITGTVSGRLSSSEPNMQQITSRLPLPDEVMTEDEKEVCTIRDHFFAPDEDSIIIGFDLSQAEVRVQALLAQDKEMIQVYTNDEDIYITLAAKALGKDKSEIDKQTRRLFKGLVLGMQYGMGPKTLAEKLEIEFSESKELMNHYFSIFSNVRKYRDQLDSYYKYYLQHFRIVYQYAPTRKRILILGPTVSAKRYIPSPLSVFNTPIQGFTSDWNILTLFALLYDFYDKHPEAKSEVYPMNLIHDAIYIVAKKKWVDELKEMIHDYYGRFFEIIPESIYEISIKNIEKLIPEAETRAIVLVPMKIELEVENRYWVKG